MATAKDNSHINNVANYEIQITIFTSWGTAYNPSKPGLKLTAMNTQLLAAKAAMNGINAAEAASKNAKDARKVGFSLLAKLITRVNNALKASDTSSQTIESAATIVRKLKGQRATPKKTVEEKEAAIANGEKVVEISSSQMNFVNQLDNLDKFIKLLSSIPAYTPNENDLKVTSLTTLYNDLKAKNLAVATTEVALNNARTVRNDVLYKPDTGLVDIALDAKNYTKSLFGAKSPQYKSISSLKFTRYKL